MVEKGTQVGTKCSTGKGAEAGLGEDQGGKRNLDVRGKRVAYTEVRNKLFHSLLC